jgi:hypothetical protein
MSQPFKTHFPIHKFAAVVLFSYFAVQVPASAQDLNNLEKGREFMYCGKLVMHLLQTQGKVDGDPGKYKLQEKNTYTKMLMTSGAYIPGDQLNAESTAAEDRLLNEILGVSEKESTEQGATERFLKSRYDYCQEFDKKHALEAIERFAAEAATRKASPSVEVK